MKAKEKPNPVPTTDPIAFWTEQHNNARRDAAHSRKHAPSTTDRHVRLQREAWEKLTAARQTNENATNPPAAEVLDVSLEGQLRTIHRMRREAETAGSHVAARQLLTDEREVASAIRARDAEAAKAARDGMTEDEKIEALVTRINALPAKLRGRVMGHLTASGEAN